MLVFLIGYMGSGKSTAGQPLADRLDVPFIDLDNWIEEHSGLTINQWFRDLGEDEFRMQEREQLENVIAKHDHAVIATGGGTPCFQDNMNLMQEAGITIYLEWNEEELFENLKNATAHRPLLAGKSDQEIRSFIEEHLRSRKRSYLLSEYVVEAREMSVNSLAELVGSYSR